MKSILIFIDRKNYLYHIANNDSCVDLANGSFGWHSDRVNLGSGHFRVNMIRFGLGRFQFESTLGQLIFSPIGFSWKEKRFRQKMFMSGSVRYGSFLVRVNFKSIISIVSSSRISVRSIRVIRIRSLLPGLINSYTCI